MNTLDKYKGMMSEYKYNKYKQYAEISDPDEFGVLYSKQEKRLMMCPDSELTEYAIKEGTEVILDYAFSDCKVLRKITIPSSITTIGHCVFMDCGNIARFEVAEDNLNYCAVDGILYSKDLTNLIQYPAAKPDTSFRIPDHVTHICSYAFSRCKSLTEVTIGPNVTGIERAAFFKCIKLVHVNYCATACETKVGPISGVFNCCCKLTKVSIGENVTSLPDDLFMGCNALEEITIPESVTHIGSAVFSGCTKLKHITIPAGVTELSGSTFYYCVSMESVTLPDTVKVIGKHVFQDCFGLKEFRIPRNVKEIGKSAFFHCTGLTKVTLPDGLESIGNYAFSDCDNLKTIRIPRSVTSIGRSVFNRYQCRSIKLEIDARNASYCVVDDVLYTKDMTTLVAHIAPFKQSSFIVPPTVKEIADDAFMCCNINAITLPEGLTHIGENAFSCSSLTSITLPSTVVEIWSGALAYCPYLTTLTSLNPIPPNCGELLFSDPDSDDVNDRPFSTCTLRVPKGAKQAYATHVDWREFKHIEEMEG